MPGMTFGLPRAAVRAASGVYSLADARGGAARGCVRRALVRPCDRRPGGGERPEVRRAGAHPPAGRRWATRCSPRSPAGTASGTSASPTRATRTARCARRSSRSTRCWRAGSPSSAAAPTGALLIAAYLVSLAAFLGGARGAPPAGGARAGARARALHAAAARGLPRRALLRRALLREPLPARLGRRVLRRPHRPLGGGGRLRRRGVGHPQRRARAAAAARAVLVDLAARAGRATPRGWRSRRSGSRRTRSSSVSARATRCASSRCRTPGRATSPGPSWAPGTACAPRSTARASWGRASARTCTSSRPAAIPYRVAAINMMLLGFLAFAAVASRRRVAPPPAALRRLRGRGAGAAALVPGRPAAAHVAATLPRRAVPDLHVAGAGLRGAALAPTARWRCPRSGSACSRPSTPPGTSSREPPRGPARRARHARASSQPPAPRLRAAARARPASRWTRSAPRAGFGAEIAYYLEHHLEGADRASLDDLRDRCAEALREALALPGLDHATARRAMLGRARVHGLPRRRARPARAARGRPRPGGGEQLGLLAARVARARRACSTWSTGWCPRPWWAPPSPTRPPFRRALELAGAEPGEALHVGDSPENDVAGRARGRRARRARGPRARSPPAWSPAVRSLAELASLV